jgi:hypothetical protein
MGNKIKLEISEPIVISQAKEDIKTWGCWQFPLIERFPDGKLYVSFQVVVDTAEAYGKHREQAISNDNGETWEDGLVYRKYDDSIGLFGATLNNGDRFEVVQKNAIPAGSLNLPRPIAESKPYGNGIKIYDAKDFPEETKGWYFLRLPKGSDKWELEQAVVDFPGETRYSCDGLVPIPFLWRMRKAPDGKLWGVHYDFMIGGKCPVHLMRPIFLVSEDNGRTWTYRSEIPYIGNKGIDPHSDKRDGFTEPNITFMPDGSIFCLLRTSDGNGKGPMYWSRSTDDGFTWSKPEYFDDRGVWPSIITLNNGVTLASYGRPGVYFRATEDPSGLEWDDRYEILAPDSSGKANTCSYTEMVEIDDNTAYLVYSDFFYPYGEGNRRKTILGRKIVVHK